MSAITKFTPGPWRVFEHLQNDGMEVVADDGRKWYHWSRRIAAGKKILLAEVGMSIGETRGYPEVTNAEEFYANAALIAAAPELYSALDDLLEWALYTGMKSTRLDKAAAALAKARGEADQSLQ